MEWNEMKWNENWKGSENYKLLDWSEIIMDNQCLPKPKGIFMPLNQYGRPNIEHKFFRKRLVKRP